MTTNVLAIVPATDEVTLLRRRVADLEQQVAAYAAAGERLTRVESELRMFKTLVESAIDGISFATPDRIVRYANTAFGEMSGYGDQCIGVTISDFISPEERAAVQQEVGPAIRDTGHWQGRIPYLRPNGVVWQAQASIFRVTGPDGSPIGQAIILRDATEQIRNEQERAALHEQVIAAQQAALRELSTPIIPLTDELVAMPLIGTIDSNRAQQVIETLLAGVASSRATTAILDITGVQIVDTQVANALLRAAQAVKLLGARVVLTGIRPEVAQTLVGLGLDLGGIITHATLQSGIAFALAGRAIGADSNRASVGTKARDFR
jgi:PAS domain S-box-containing protein